MVVLVALMLVGMTAVSLFFWVVVLGWCVRSACSAVRSAAARRNDAWMRSRSASPLAPPLLTR